jgi:hypothetical protein
MDLLRRLFSDVATFLAPNSTQTKVKKKQKSLSRCGCGHTSEGNGSSHLDSSHVRSFVVVTEGRMRSSFDEAPRESDAIRCIMRQQQP